MKLGSATLVTTRLTKSWIWLIGALLVCASAQAAAQVCERERQVVIAATKGKNNADIGELTKYVQNSVRYGEDCASRCKPFQKGVNSPEYADALRSWARDNDWKAENDHAILAVQYRLSACIARHIASNLGGSPGNVAGNTPRPSPPVPAPAPTPAPPLAEPLNPNNPHTGAPHDQSAVQRLALDRVQERQARVDQVRQLSPGLPKLHESGNVAHQCLKPQPNGGVRNICPYAVEYNYCVLHPRKGSSSEAFDCENSKGGAWQVGPNDGSIMHTDGETTYFFACRYGETLSKPDGFGPADIEYQRGRGILGRCAKWGSRRG